MDNRNKIQLGDKKTLPILIVTTLILVVIAVKEIIKAINFYQRNFGNSKYLLLSIGEKALIIKQLVITIIIVIMAVASLKALWLTIDLRRNKIKVKRHPVVRQIYNIKLINYECRMEIGEFNKNSDSYCRGLPCGKDLLLAFWISYQYKITTKPEDFLGAVLLKLIRENNIKTIDKNENEYYLNLSLIEKCEYEYEYILLDILKESATNNILTKKEAKAFFSDNYKKISDWFNYCLRYEEEKLIASNLIKKENKWYFENSYKNIIPSSEINDIAQNMVGLKNFLLDFSLIKEKK